MRNEVIFDSRGIPDIMVVFTPDELGLPAEIKGKAVKEYAISKYPNTLIGDVPYSMPYQQPAVNVNHDEAIRLCEAKGPGWHLLTNDEWAALAHQSRKNGTLPRGNTDCGKSHSHPEETGTTYKDSGSSKTLTGSGPVTWNHDHTAEGVADMCGNIWEHVGGIRFVDGQVQVIPDNGAAAGADQSESSKEWTPLYTADGDTIFYNVEDGEIKLQPIAPDGKDYDGVPFVDLDGSALEVPEKLIELGLYPTSEDYNGRDYFWLDTDGERIVLRGGGWGDGADAGVFSFYGGTSRANGGASVGFRSALVRYSGDSGDLDNLDSKDGKQADEPKEENAAPSFDTLSSSVQLPTLVRLILARQLTVLYEAAGGKDPEGFKRIANTATDKELQQAAALSLPLSQVNTAVELYRNASQQIKIANTLTLTIGKEATDHE